MNNIRIGDLINKIRIKKGISLKDLSMGICSVSNLHRIEYGERETDKFTIDCIWQRLGKTSNIFDFVLTQKEYELWNLRIKINEMVFNANKKCTLTIMHKYYELTLKKSRIHLQYLGYYYLYLLESEPISKYKTYIINLKILNLSIPNFKYNNWNHYYLNIIELLLISNIYCIFGKIGKTEESILGYKMILTYMDINNYENKLKNILYLDILFKVINIKEIWKYRSLIIEINKRIEILFLQINYDLSVFLYDLQTDKDSASRIDNPELYIRGLFQKYFSQIVLCAEEENYKIKLISKIIRDRRKYMNQTQEELSDGVCSVITISRLENGKYSPKINVLSNLMKKLGCNEEYCNGIYIIEDNRVYEIFNHLFILTENNNIIFNPEYFKVLKNKISMKIIRNKQVIEMAELINKRIKNEISSNNYIENMKGILLLSLKLYDINKVKINFLTNLEKTILLSIAREYLEEKKFGYAFEIITLFKNKE